MACCRPERTSNIDQGTMNVERVTHRDVFLFLHLPSLLQSISREFFDAAGVFDPFDEANAGSEPNAGGVFRAAPPRGVDANPRTFVECAGRDFEGFKPFDRDFLARIAIAGDKRRSRSGNRRKFEKTLRASWRKPC